jgi:hypothetical protein
VTQPANGAVAITGGGTGLTYTPNANYCNTAGDDARHVHLHARPGRLDRDGDRDGHLRRRPAGGGADAATVIEDSGANAIDVLANDTDIDGGPKTVTSVTQPANGAWRSPAAAPTSPTRRT